MNFFDHKDLGNHLLQLCPKVVKHSVYENSIFTSQSTQPIYTAKTSQLMLYREVISVYYDSNMKDINTHYSKMQSFLMLPKMVHVVSIGSQMVK